MRYIFGSRRLAARSAAVAALALATRLVLGVVSVGFDGGMSDMAFVADELPLDRCSYPVEEMDEEKIGDEKVNISNEEKNDNVPLSDEEQRVAREIADKYEVEVELLYAIMYAESGYDASARSYNGSSIGIMQINRINAGWLRDMLGINDLYDYRQNVTAGAAIISDLIDRYGDVGRALVCYKYGEAGAARLWAQGKDDHFYKEKVKEEYNRIIS